MSLIVKMLLSGLAVLLGAYLLPGVAVDNFITALIVAVVLAVLNSLLKPVLVVLTIPVTIITFGLFLLVINAFIILMAEWLIEGFLVDGFWSALLFSFVLSALTWVAESFQDRK